MPLQRGIKLTQTSHVAWTNESCHTYKPVSSLVRMSYVTHIHESGHTYKYVMSHIWMSHVTHMNESCRTYEWVRSHMRMSQVTHVNESCHTCEWVRSHVWMSHVTRVNESRHTCEWVVSQIDSCKGQCHSIILHVSFTKEPYNKDHILQKRPIILRSLLIVATPQLQMTGAEGHMCVSLYDMSHVTHVNESCLTISHVRIAGAERHITTSLTWIYLATRVNESRPSIRSIQPAQIKNYRSLLQKSPIKETVFCKRDI